MVLDYGFLLSGERKRVQSEINLQDEPNYDRLHGVTYGIPLKSVIGQLIRTALHGDQGNESTLAFLLPDFCSKVATESCL